MDASPFATRMFDAARLHGMVLDNVDAKKLADYAASQPLAVAAEDDTGHFNQTLKTVLLDQYDNLLKGRKPKTNDKIVKHCDVHSVIDGISHKLTIESSISTDALTSYMTNLRIMHQPPQRGTEDPAGNLLVIVTLALNEDGSVGLAERWSIEIDPTIKYPESVIESLVGEPLERLISSPLSRHPAMARVKVIYLKNEGPWGNTPETEVYMLTARLARPL